MENKTIFPIDEFVVTYKDNNFIKITTLQDKLSYYHPVDKMPSTARVGDIITEYTNQVTKTSIFKVTQKSTAPQKRLEQVVAQDNEIGFVFNGKFVKDNYLTYIAQKFANACGIKKIQNIQINKYSIAKIFNHTICLCNINNFNQKKYVADIDLEANANHGDIYYYLTINTASGFVFDEQADQVLFDKYYSLFSQQEFVFEIDEQQMQELDKVNTKLFNKSFKFDFVESWQIDDVVIEDSGKKFLLYNDNSEDLKIVYEKDMPSLAREGDFVGITKDGKFEYDRQSFLQFLEKINNIVYGDRL